MRSFKFGIIVPFVSVAGGSADAVLSVVEPIFRFKVVYICGMKESWECSWMMEEGRGTTRLQ